MKEVLIDMPNYEGLYQVSNTGRVISLPKNDGNGNKLRELKLDITTQKRTSYARVTVCKDGITKRFLVHRLVAELFIPNPDNKPCVNHIDNNGLNNNVSNLEWVTQDENMRHSVNQDRQIVPQTRATEAAVIANYARYIKVWQNKLQDRFIAYYAPHEVSKTNARKDTAAVAYRCKKCNIARKASTSWAELTKYNGTCPNCYTVELRLLEEDIV